MLTEELLSLTSTPFKLTPSLRDVLQQLQETLPHGVPHFCPDYCLCLPFLLLPSRLLFSVFPYQFSHVGILLWTAIQLMAESPPTPFKPYLDRILVKWGKWKNALVLREPVEHGVGSKSCLRFRIPMMIQRTFFGQLQRF